MGHHGWGHHGNDWGFGWFFPALIVGKVIGEVIERSQTQPWGGPQPWPPAPQTPPRPQPPAQPQPAAAPGKATSFCWNCSTPVSAAFAFCPHCGKRLEPPACRYCGQTLDIKTGYCPHCGAPQNKR